MARMFIAAGILAAVTAAFPSTQSSTTSRDPVFGGSTAPNRALEILAWGDWDGDGLDDAFARDAAGHDRILRNGGDGAFEDVSETALACLECTSEVAVWIDADGDGALDVYALTDDGRSRMLLNLNGVLEDVADAAGLLHELPVVAAHWLDYDGDERVDLHVVTHTGDVLFHNLGALVFERVAFPEIHEPVETEGVSVRSSVPASDPSEVSDIGAERGKRRTPRGRRPVPSALLSPTDAALGGGAPRVIGKPDPGSFGTPATVAISGPVGFLPCAGGIANQNGTACIQASTRPTLGNLYPLSVNLFVGGNGSVGIGTTSPAARLEVAGTARVTDTLTLAPAGDQALDVATGSIYKAGALFLHTKGGTRNTALGEEALASVTISDGNTATGYRTLYSNTTGPNNTASGANALRSNTTGSNNTASGYSALFSNTDGNNNTANGYRALFSNTGGNNNTANGFLALYSNTLGSNNTASGTVALYSNTTGYHNTASGYRAMFSNTTGAQNAAHGYRALYSNTNGFRNTASGFFAMYSNTEGDTNTAIGNAALRFNVSGDLNTACGSKALGSNTAGDRNAACGSGALYGNTIGHRNTANGYRALAYNTTGNDNTACGYRAGEDLTGDDNIAIGNGGVAGESNTVRVGNSTDHTRAFIAGIRGVTTGAADAIAVLIDSDGQLGTVSSSCRFKEDVRDMDGATARLLELRPVVFRYKPEVQDGERPLEYGLIAEEVAEVFPELVVHDEEGKPFTVKYHLLSSMLLNELKQLSERHGRELDELRARLAALEEREAPGALVANTR